MKEDHPQNRCQAEGPVSTFLAPRSQEGRTSHNLLDPLSLDGLSTGEAGSAMAAGSSHNNVAHQGSLKDLQSSRSSWLG